MTSESPTFLRQRKRRASRQRRRTRIRAQSLHILRFVLGDNLSADQTIKCLTYLTRLALKAP